MDDNKKIITILLIDDDETSLFLYSEILKFYFKEVEISKYEIYLARNRDEIAEKIVYLKKAIDIVVTRKNLPETSGKLICRAIRKVNPQAKVFVVSTAPIADEKYEWLREGFNGYLSKPINKEEFLRTILS